MGKVLSFVVVLATTLMRLLTPGGVKGLAAENVALRQQLLMLDRGRRRAPDLSLADRILHGLASLLIKPVRFAKVAIVVRPSTLIQLHRALVRRKYKALFSPKARSKPGPKGPSAELRAAIVALKRRNPRFGCPRITMIISETFGVEIDKDVVRRVLACEYRPAPGRNGPSWLSFLGHAKDSLWSIDLFRCESVVLKSYWVMLVLDQHTRRIVGFAINRGPVDARAVCRMFDTAVAAQPLPRLLSSDHDPLFHSHRWQANLRVLEIAEVKTVPGVPMSHPFIERAIGTVRHEFLDHTLFWNSVDLQRKLDGFRHYYNEHRVHAALRGRTPSQVADGRRSAPVQLNTFGWTTHCGGLVQLPVAV